MASNSQQKKVIREFLERWENKGREDGDKQPFWLDLLQTVYGIEIPSTFIDFEQSVRLISGGGTKKLDGYIPSTKVLIEHKTKGTNLSLAERQSDGELLTPFEQALRYNNNLPASKKARWIVVSNFTTFEIHDLEHPTSEPVYIELKDLEREYPRMSFLVDGSNIHLEKELSVSVAAGEIVGMLYDQLLPQYVNPDSEESQKSLNKLCVRLVFCLYAEDAGIFGRKNMFHDYMAQFSAVEFREKLIKLFVVLDTKDGDRLTLYLPTDLAEFPYVNGGLFSGEIEIPRITEEIRNLILTKASDDFDWSEISPTIFGAVFESTLNPQTRREGGMHYTSIENIHKVIDPLFLNSLKKELKEIKNMGIARNRRKAAIEMQNRLADLKFLDPACGSGNFLTETYISLRKIENELIKIIYDLEYQREMGDLYNPVKVSIGQFYGIEINDFACSVAETALWIAESQMLEETNRILNLTLDPLPLKSYSNIREGNALRMDWNEVVRADKLDYIMGNPPFNGARTMTPEQKEDLIGVFGENWKNIGNMDYVTGWYWKCSEMMERNPKIKAALVSTNSISQGEQPPLIFKPLFEKGIHLDFAYRTFIWDSQASGKAHVHCVIVGFSKGTDSMRGGIKG